jgi:hypothetical protein
VSLESAKEDQLSFMQKVLDEHIHTQSNFRALRALIATSFAMCHTCICIAHAYDLVEYIYV